MPRNSGLYCAVSYRLSQHVTGNTHCHCHTLDVVISKGLNRSATVQDVAFSDHYCIFFEMWTSLNIKTRHICFKKTPINDSTAALLIRRKAGNTLDKSPVQGRSPDSTLKKWCFEFTCKYVKWLHINNINTIPAKIALR